MRRPRTVASGLLALCLCILSLAGWRASPARGQDAAPASGRADIHARPFRISVVDDETGRGVPLVELTTTHGVKYVTDSAGVIALDEPGLAGQEVFFHVKSHGYSFPKDGFGYAGTRLKIAPGGSATVKIHRDNVAERLYRITGGGIYRDSVILGDASPIDEPLLNGEVFGQDTVEVVPYRGKLFWFWGDTNQVAYPLGNFAVSGATSELPGRDDLDPSVGVNLTYFVDEQGFSKKMCPIEGQPGPVWIDGLVTVPDDSGRERLLSHFVRVKTLGELYEQGFAVYNDEKEIFEPVARFPLDAPLHLRSHPIRVRERDGVEYYYFPAPYPHVRCQADYHNLLDVTQYEAFTCLKPGARYDKTNPALDRDASGKLIYAWKRDTAPIGPAEQNELVQGKHIRADEGLIQTRDTDIGNPVQMHSGSVCWNDYKGKWVMIGQQIWGKPSLGGEIWYAESDSLTGPWPTARKIVTHDDYTFYNVTQHPYFDQDGGRVIYFEGTYTAMFSGNKNPTPRYDYNQIMYRLNLDDPRLHSKADINASP